MYHVNSIHFPTCFHHST